MCGRSRLKILWVTKSIRVMIYFALMIKTLWLGTTLSWMDLRTHWACLGEMKSLAFTEGNGSKICSNATNLPILCSLRGTIGSWWPRLSGHLTRISCTDLSSTNSRRRIKRWKNCRNSTSEGSCRLIWSRWAQVRLKQVRFAVTAWIPSLKRSRGSSVTRAADTIYVRSARRRKTWAS